MSKKRKLYRGFLAVLLTLVLSMTAGCGLLSSGDNGTADDPTNGDELPDWERPTEEEMEELRESARLIFEDFRELRDQAYHYGLEEAVVDRIRNLLIAISIPKEQWQQKYNYDEFPIFPDREWDPLYFRTERDMQITYFFHWASRARKDGNILEDLINLSPETLFSYSPHYYEREAAKHWGAARREMFNSWAEGDRRDFIREDIAEKTIAYSEAILDHVVFDNPIIINGKAYHFKDFSYPFQLFLIMEVMGSRIRLIILSNFTDFYDGSYKGRSLHEMEDEIINELDNIWEKIINQKARTSSR